MRTTLFSLAFLTFFGGMTAQNTLVDRTPAYNGGFLSVDPVETPLVVSADFFVLNEEVALGDLKLYAEYIKKGDPENDIEGLNIWIFENDDLLPAGYPDEPGTAVVELTQISLDKFTVEDDPAGRSDNKIITISFTEANDGEQIVLQPGNYWLIAAPMINNPLSDFPNVNLWYWGVSANAAPVTPLFYDPSDAGGMGATDWTPISSITPGFPAFAWHLTDEEKTLDTNNFEANSFSVFPNPVNDVLHIQSNLHEEIHQITLYTLTGQRIKESQKNDQLDLSELPAGIYLVKIETAKGTVTKKVIKN